ncbi:MAG: YegS/Rv2252/BmrU family lipid kinase [Acidobacteriota bacterium]|nr:YegS/Rv2252/BmrU family lipid kinase [Acidobacteriota bacterium]
MYESPQWEQGFETPAANNATHASRFTIPGSVLYHPAVADHSKLFIIINNVAAKARAAWPAVRERLQTAGVDFEAAETTCAGDATLRTRAALRAGFETIVVIGGDGTLSESAEGFFELAHSNFSTSLPIAVNPAASLAILPAGTGDDFARGLMKRRVPLADWLELLVVHCQQHDNSTTRAVDVMVGMCDGEEKQFICLNASTMGIGGETGARVAAQGKFMRQFSGEVRFLAAALGALSAWRERRVRVVVDGQELSDAPMNLVAVANGLYAGGGMMLSPQARNDDGFLDVVTARGLNRIEIMRELPRIHSGGHVANPKVQIFQGRHVRIETFASSDALLIEADGNVRGRTPVEFRILPHALKIVSPKP